MKIRAVANGEVIDVSEQEAKPLLEAGIYELVKEEATKVEPLTTNDMQPRKRVR